MTHATPEPGLVVGGRYRLESRLGEGGMAVVWTATHTETDRRVALKIVKRELAGDQQARELFVREARIAARIGRSEHIVDVLDAGIDDALGAPFLAMELLEGEPLDERLRRAGPLEPALATLVLEQLAEALDQAHAASVVHRDLKPQNLFLTRTKKGGVSVKVLDFGIAKIAENATQGATQIGTPAYAAPEQLGPTWRVMGDKAGKRIADRVSPATDVWAFGIVAFELYTGARSGDFWGAATVAEVPLKIVLEPIPAASTRAGAHAARLPPGFDAWLARCLELDAERRWPTAGEAVRALFGSPAAAEARPGTSAPPQAAYPSAPPTGQAAGTATTPWTPPLTGPPTPHGAGTSWPSQRADIRVGGDPQVYRAWQPFHFIPSIGGVSREARMTVRDQHVLVGEILTSDELMRAVGQTQFMLALVSAPKARYRVALRPRQSAGLGDSLSRSMKALDAFMGAQPKAASVAIGDAWLESRFEIAATSPQEAHYALPLALRQLLVHQSFGGVLETRPGGVVIALLDRPRFEGGGLDYLLGMADGVLAAFG